MPSAPHISFSTFKDTATSSIVNRDLERLSIQLEANIASAQHVLSVSRSVPDHELADVLRALRLARDAVGAFSRRQIERLREMLGEMPQFSETRWGLSLYSPIYSVTAK